MVTTQKRPTAFMVFVELNLIGSDRSQVSETDALRAVRQALRECVWDGKEDFEPAPAVLIPYLPDVVGARFTPVHIRLSKRLYAPEINSFHAYLKRLGVAVYAASGRRCRCAYISYEVHSSIFIR